MDKDFLLTTLSRPVLEPTQHPTQFVQGALFTEIKQQKREAGYLPPPVTEDKNKWIYTSTPPYMFLA
jgi:hypothetical protein